MLPNILLGGALSLGITTTLWYGYTCLRPYQPIRQVKRKAKSKPLSLGYPAEWDAIGEAKVLEEAALDSLTERKAMARKYLGENPDVAVDAVAEKFSLSVNVARGLCRGLGRNTKASHKGNDYDVRGDSSYA